ncbi:23S rRNA pseudouridylate synthase B, partial [Mycobacterium tuberculosis]
QAAATGHGAGQGPRGGREPRGERHQGETGARTPAGTARTKGAQDNQRSAATAAEGGRGGGATGTRETGQSAGAT